MGSSSCQSHEEERFSNYFLKKNNNLILDAIHSFKVAYQGQNILNFKQLH